LASIIFRKINPMAAGADLFGSGDLVERLTASERRANRSLKWAEDNSDEFIGADAPVAAAVQRALFEKIRLVHQRYMRLVHQRYMRLRSPTCLAQ
jgi:hypothetical protein